MYELLQLLDDALHHVGFIWEVNWLAELLFRFCQWTHRRELDDFATEK